MNKRILNRNFALPADGWYHIEVTGEHYNAGAEVTQVIDAAAVRSIVNRFEPGETGMLIDQDHFSHDLDKSTAASGWLMAVMNRGGELYGKIRWSALGRDQVEGGELRLFSTEYDPADVEELGGGKIRPLRLSGLTLTNRPNNKGGKPISNREKNNLAEARKADAPTKKTTNMKNVATALGLKEDASEGDVLAAISKLKNAGKETAEKVENMEKEIAVIRNRDADAFLKEHAGRVGEDADTVAHFREGLIKNREVTEKVILSLPQAKTEDRKPLHNRETAKNPPPVSGESAADQQAKQRRAIDAIKNRDKCSFDQAFSRAQSENRELFVG